jgi:hypothetical protein
VIPSEALPAVKSAHRVSSTLRRSDGVHLRIVSERSPGPGATPAEVTLEDAYLWHIGGGAAAGNGAVAESNATAVAEPLGPAAGR